MAKQVRIALIGNSHAEAVQLPTLAHIGGNEVIGIAGRDAQKAAASAERWGIDRSTSNWRELLELEPDLVIVATPVDLHFEMVLAALSTGAAVLCEKPLALDVRQAEELARLAQGRLALINYQMRWNPNRRKMRSLCQSGFVGEVHHVRADLLLDIPGFLERPYSWWSQSDRGGGVLGATGTHLIDNVQWMFGPIQAVSARFETIVPRRRDGEGVEHDVTSEDYAELWLRLESGARVSMAVGFGLRGNARWVLEVAGSVGALRLDREQHLVGSAHGGELAPIPSDTPWLPPEHYGIQGKGPFAALEGPFLSAVVEAVAEGQTTLAEAATFADGVNNARVLEAARRSAQTEGSWVGC